MASIPEGSTEFCVRVWREGKWGNRVGVRKFEEASTNSIFQNQITEKSDLFPYVVGDHRKLFLESKDAKQTCATKYLQAERARRSWTPETLMPGRILRSLLEESKWNTNDGQGAGSQSRLQRLWLGKSSSLKEVGLQGQSRFYSKYLTCFVWA